MSPMNARSISRWSFVGSLVAVGLSWLREALDEGSPGGDKITDEEIYDVISRVLAILGIMADPEDLQSRLKDLF